MPESFDFNKSDRHLLPTNAAQLKRWLPWLELFRGFRIAIDYQKMFVALIAIYVMSLSNHAINDAFLPENSLAHSDTQINIQRIATIAAQKSRSKKSRTSFINDWRLKEPSLSYLTDQTFIKPLRSAVALLTLKESKIRSFHWWQLVTWLLICGLFGGAIARMGAREFTGNHRSLLRDCRYAVRKFPAAILAPLLGLLAFALPWAANWMAGMFGRIPLIGELLMAFFWAIVVLLGLVMALAFIGTFFGWPLMFASTAVEDNDASDALSRALSYLLNRPWYALFLSGISFVYGTLLCFFVSHVVHLTMLLSLNSVAHGTGKELNISYASSITEMGVASQNLFEGAAASAILEFWIHKIVLIPHAFAFSFFWSSATIIYLLLRRREDGTPLKEINLSDSVTQARPAFPLVGVPAAEKREAELQSENKE